MLLDVAYNQLNFEVIDVGFGDFVQPKKDRLEIRKIGYPIDLLVQAFQLIQRIQVLGAHDVILHF
jgi:hypothetical protein